MTTSQVYKKRMRKFRPTYIVFSMLFSFFLVSFLPETAEATAPLILNDYSAEYFLGTNLEMLRDATGRLTINEVSSPEQSYRFAPVIKKRPNLGYTHDAIWYRFVVINETAERSWVLNTGREWIEEVTLYHRSPKGQWEHFTTGAKIPHMEKPIVSEHPLLPLVIAQGGKQEYYLQLKSDNTAISLLLMVVSADRFAHSDALGKLLYGGFYAVLFVMALYNVILAVSLKNALFAKLAAILFCIAIGESGAHAHLTYALLPTLPLAVQQISTMGLALAGASIGIFAMDLLVTKRHDPVLHVVMIGMVSVLGLLAVSAAITLRVHEAVQWANGLGAPVVIAAGVRRYMHRDRAAAYFTFALMALVVPAIFVIGGIVGILPLYPATEHGAHIGGIIMSILLSLGVAEQVNRVNRASQRFLPKPFLGKLGHASIADVKVGDSIEAEMTVLFSDIRNFTTRSEQLSPSETFLFLNTYLSYMVPAIEKNGGLIDKYIGDAIMALYPDSADSALAAALAMQDAVLRLNDNRPLGQEPIQIGIGIHRGRLMLGTVGDKNRIDVTVISDAVNVASRLESLTKEKGEAIIVSSDVVRALKNPESFSLKQLGTTSIKGRVNAVEIWAVKTDSGLMV